MKLCMSKASSNLFSWIKPSTLNIHQNLTCWAASRLITLPEKNCLPEHRKVRYYLGWRQVTCFKIQNISNPRRNEADKMWTIILNLPSGTRCRVCFFKAKWLNNEKRCWSKLCIWPCKQLQVPAELQSSTSCPGGYTQCEHSTPHPAFTSGLPGSWEKVPESARSAVAQSGAEAVTEAALRSHKSLGGAHLQPEESLYLPQQQLLTLLGLVLCSQKTHNGWQPNPSCCPKGVKFPS